MKQEIWKEIDGYEGLYQVSNLGNVKSLKNGRWGTGKERILMAGKHKLGYLFVILFKEGKMKNYKVHRLVAEAFIPNPQKLPEVNHKDEDKSNNRVENLEWCDRKYNCNYGTRTERTSKRVICEETGIVYPSLSEVYRQLGFDNSYIGACCKGRYKQAYGYTWRYVE